MMCDSCEHVKVCKYFSEYIRFHRTIKEAFEVRMNASKFRDNIPFKLPDIICAHYFEKSESISSHDDSDDPDEKGFKADSSISSVPPPTYPMIYCHCPCDDPTIT